ncbi:MAG: AbrB family transcriptional regulator [Treponema sp.]|jgi:membrane AbrB-like protein|nr:AbrB family transcriptional regulator [Treponema sp.]
MNLIYLLFTLVVGLIFGLLFILLKVPNGLRIGALLGAALLSIFFKAAWMPPQTRLAVQAVAGALIGCTMERSDLRRLPQVFKPACIMLASFFILNITAGALIHMFSPLDWVTSLMCAIPGGVTDTPIIAADMGADTPKVAVVQLARFIMGIAVFPPMILAWDTLRKKKEDQGREEVSHTGKRLKSSVSSPQAFLCTLSTAILFGIIGDISRIPAGAFLFSIIAVLFLKLKFDFAYIPPIAKKCALLISGCYIGSAIGIDDVYGFRVLAIPLLITLAGYILNCFITGKILFLACGFTRKEGMLVTTPAGASDIALSAADIGVENTDVIIIQIFRAVIAMAVFPQVINLLLLVLK